MTLHLEGPIRRRTLGDYTLRVATVDGHRTLIVEHPTKGTAVLHFITRPHEADEVFDDITAASIDEVFRPLGTRQTSQTS